MNIYSFPHIQKATYSFLPKRNVTVMRYKILTHIIINTYMFSKDTLWMYRARTVADNKHFGGFTNVNFSYTIFSGHLTYVSSLILIHERLPCQRMNRFLMSHSQNVLMYVILNTPMIGRKHLLPKPILQNCKTCMYIAILITLRRISPFYVLAHISIAMSLNSLQVSL